MLVTNRLLFFFLNNAKLRTPNPTVTYIAKIMENNELLSLTQRLENAEQTLKFINKEINEIKAKILIIQTTGAPLNNLRQYSTNKRQLEDAQPLNEDVKKQRYNFEMKDDYVVVYTDGACTNNGKLTAKAGIGVWFGPHHPLNFSKPVDGKPTNNVAEIQACIAAVQLAIQNDIKKLCIKTDSQLVINSITNWIKKWKKNNWKSVNGNDVKNKVDLVKLDGLCEKLNVKWEYVPGHSNYVGNEGADALARAGANKYVMKD